MDPPGGNGGDIPLTGARAAKKRPVKNRVIPKKRPSGLVVGKTRVRPTVASSTVCSAAKSIGADGSSASSKPAASPTLNANPSSLPINPNVISQSPGKAVSVSVGLSSITGTKQVTPRKRPKSSLSIGGITTAAKPVLAITPRTNKIAVAKHITPTKTTMIKTIVTTPAKKSAATTIKTTATPTKTMELNADAIPTKPPLSATSENSKAAIAKPKPTKNTLTNKSLPKPVPTTPKQRPTRRITLTQTTTIDTTATIPIKSTTPKTVPRNNSGSDSLPKIPSPTTPKTTITSTDKATSTKTAISKTKKTPKAATLRVRKSLRAKPASISTSSSPATHTKKAAGAKTTSDAGNNARPKPELILTTTTTETVPPITAPTNTTASTKTTTKNKTPKPIKAAASKPKAAAGKRQRGAVMSISIGGLAKKKKQQQPVSPSSSTAESSLQLTSKRRGSRKKRSLSNVTTDTNNTEDNDDSMSIISHTTDITQTTAVSIRQDVPIRNPWDLDPALNIPKPKEGEFRLRDYCSAYKIKKTPEQKMQDALEREERKKRKEQLEAARLRSRGETIAAIQGTDTVQAAGPRVQVVDGEIRLVEDSVVLNAVRTAEQIDAELGGDNVVTEEDGGTLMLTATYTSFTDWTQRRTEWTHDNTRKFYMALRQCGTDFDSIQFFFQGVFERKQLKRKYALECRKNAELIDLALNPKSRVPLEFDKFGIESEVVDAIKTKGIKKLPTKKEREEAAANANKDDAGDDSSSVLSSNKTKNSSSSSAGPALDLLGQRLMPPPDKVMTLEERWGFDKEDGGDNTTVDPITLEKKTSAMEEEEEVMPSFGLVPLVSGNARKAKRPKFKAKATVRRKR